jgi:hypothetical protein
VHIRYFIKLLLVHSLIVLCFYPALAQSSTQEVPYPFTLDKNEQAVYLIKDNNTQTAFLVKYDTKSKSTRLKAVQYNTAYNKTTNSIVIDSAKVGTWQKSASKGNVRQSFENAVMSGKPQSEQIPLEYQYQISVSPDKQTILCYRYDYSQPTLYIAATLLNSKLEKGPKLQLPVDEGLINHQVFINNRKDIFLLHTDQQDGILLIRYQPDTDQSTLLEVAASSSQRHSFLPHISGNDTVYIANVTENNSSLSGVMYTRFNFGTQRVEEVQYHALSKEILKKLNASSDKGRFHLISFKMSPQKHFLLEVQKKNIEATGYTYDPFALNDPMQWKPRKSLITAGDKLLFEFDSTGKLVSEKFNP